MIGIRQADEGDNNMNFKTKKFAMVALIGCIGCSHAFAQGSNPVQAPPIILPSPIAQLAFPSTFGVPSAVAPKPGSGFVGLTYATPRGGISGNGGDGDFVAGYSIGNPLDAISLTFGVAITGLEPFGDAGSLSVTASRLLRAGGNSATFIGASASNLAAWGPNRNRPEQYSVYVSHLVGIQAANKEMTLQLVLGYGTDNTLDSNGSGAISDGVFAGAGFGLTQNLSASISATQTQLNAGISYSIPNTALSTSFGVIDVTDNTNRQQLTAAIAFGF